MEYRYLLQSGGKPQLEFSRDIPFPEVNLNIYREIYHTEQWLRRILYASLMFTYGEAWADSIPAPLLAELKRRRGGLKGKILFDAENSSNILWLLTLDELNQLIASEAIWPALKRYIGIPRAELYEKVNMLREIRNIIGHNRAASRITWDILSGILKSLDTAIRQFKNEVASLEKISEHLDEREEITDPKSRAIFDYCAEKRLPPDCSIFLWGRDYFYELLSFPEEHSSRKTWLNVARILEEYRELEQSILAFKVSWGGAFGIVWPKNAKNESHFRIIDRFFSTWAEIWTDTLFSWQDPKYVCDPKIWLYELEKGADAPST